MSHLVEPRLTLRQSTQRLSVPVFAVLSTLPVRVPSQITERGSALSTRDRQPGGLRMLDAEPDLTVALRESDAPGTVIPDIPADDAF
jgi:hypothetical protein